MTNRSHHRNLGYLAGRTPRTTMSVLAAADPVLRASAVFGVIMDDPHTVALFHDIDVAGGRLHRVVVDATGVIEDEWLDLPHACVSCAVREDAVPTLARLIGDGRWNHAALALPVTAESLPAAQALHSATQHDGLLRKARLSTVVCLVDGGTFEPDVLGDDTLADRDIALVVDDERAVGECIVAQLELADLVVVAGEPDATANGLIDALRGRESRRIDGLETLTAAMLRQGQRDSAFTDHHTHPLQVLLKGASSRPIRDSADRSWVLELHSDRPFHPERLLENIERLGSGRLRSRGVFWLPNRPDTVCLWDGAGGQLSIGALGDWNDSQHAPCTHLIFIGTGDERTALVEAFEECLTTADDVSDGGLAWLDREDVLEPWLGERH